MAMRLATQSAAATTTRFGLKRFFSSSVSKVNASGASSCAADFVVGAGKPPIAWMHLGADVDYSRALAVQEFLVHEHHAAMDRFGMRSGAVDVLLTLEHADVYVAGRRGRLPADKIDKLKSETNSEYVESGRGGRITFHGGGTLVAYAVYALRRRDLNVPAHVCSLLDAQVQTLSHLGLRGCEKRDGSDAGVYYRNSKIGAVGVQVARGVSFHGAAMNVRTNVERLERVAACGASNHTSALAEGISSSVDESARLFARQFQCVDLQDVSAETFEKILKILSK